jgi:hypothetical protein
MKSLNTFLYIFLLMGRMTKTHDRTGKENNRKIKNVIVGWKFTKLKG